MADITIGNMAPLDALSGQEMIPCEIDGKNYKILASQFSPLSDVSNIPTIGTIVGNEQVLVVRDGNFRITGMEQIMSYVLGSELLYKEINLSEYKRFDGIINSDATLYIASGATHYEIPVEEGDRFVISCYRNSTASSPRYAFVTMSLEGISHRGKIPYCSGSSFSEASAMVKYIIAPSNAKYLIINASYGSSDILYVLKKREDIKIEVEKISERVSVLEQSPSPANLDSISREEFDALRAEMEKMKSQMTPAVVGKETM